MMPIRGLFRGVRYAIRRARQRRALYSIMALPVKRIVVGAGNSAFPGWISTNRDNLDLLREDDWQRFFPSESLDAILAEHVLDELEPRDASDALRRCFRYLKPGGYLRAAVPDGLHPEPDYINWVRQGGTGSGAEYKKVLYDYRSFGALLRDCGFDVVYCESFDENGDFHFTDWDPAQGMVRRSKRFDSRNRAGRLAYTSIIVDAQRPRLIPTGC